MSAMNAMSEPAQTNMDDEAVVARDITLRAGERVVVRGASFTARAGELLCIAGRNGAGKTTLLRAIAGLSAYEGELHVRGVAANAPAHLRAREVAYVPQRSHLNAALPVARVVEQGRHLHRDALGRLTRADHQRVEAALDQAGASALRDRPFTALSYGEQRRVLLARALATDARVLLLDEPTAALDLSQSLRLFQLLAELKQRGYTLIVVLHALDDVMRFTDRALILHEGRVDQLGPSREVFSPATLRRVFGVRLGTNQAPRFTLAEEAP